MDDNNFSNETGQNNEGENRPVNGGSEGSGREEPKMLPPQNGGQYQGRPQNSGQYQGGPQNNGQYQGGPQNGGQYNNGQYNNGQYNRPPQRRKPPKKKKTSIVPIIVIVFAIILVFFTVFGFMLRIMSSGLAGRYESSPKTQNDEEISYSTPYIGVLSVEGTIESDNGKELSSQTYHHSWMLKKIDELKNDSKNRGLIITVNTPGGGVYESDEVYLAIKDYKETTGRPVYSYMKSQATSGGYYISAPCDKILANRNCWTGSIGVTIGTIYDLTGLMKKYGVKAVTITAGDNKAMGSYAEELTEEQQEILQGLVDEAYDQFVGIVAEGRKMDDKKVRELADGRIYTAKQAKKLGLIDGICTYDEAVEDMQKRFELDSCAVNEIKYKSRESLIYRLLMETAEIGRSRTDTELDGLKSLMEQNNKFTVTYIAEIQK